LSPSQSSLFFWLVHGLTPTASKRGADEKAALLKKEILN